MLPPSTTPELDLKTFLILRDFCQNQMFLPDAEQRVQSVFIDATEIYDDSRWRPWLSKINDMEDETFEAAEIAEHVENEIKTLQAHLSTVASSSPASPTPSLHLRAEPMDIDWDSMTEPNQTPSAPSSSMAFSSAPLSSPTSSSDLSKTRLSLKDYIARKKHEVKMGIEPSGCQYCFI